MICSTSGPPDRTTSLNAYKANQWPGSQLHAMLWAEDKEIGPMFPDWNHLVGYDAPNPNARLVHFTLGTPDMPGRNADEFACEWRSYLTVDELDDPYAELVATRPASGKRMSG
jgi:hypothetical protein